MNFREHLQGMTPLKAGPSDIAAQVNQIKSDLEGFAKQGCTGVVLDGRNLIIGTLQELQGMGLSVKQISSGDVVINWIGP